MWHVVPSGIRPRVAHADVGGIGDAWAYLPTVGGVAEGLARRCDLSEICGDGGWLHDIRGFREQVAWFVTHCSTSSVTELIGIAWCTVGAII